MKLTGVGAMLHASHDDPSGQLPRHWHSWEIKAWFPYSQDARQRQADLIGLLDRHQGSHLLPAIQWAEDLAEFIGQQLAGCVEVEISRPGEGLFAKWRAE